MNSLSSISLQVTKINQPPVIIVKKEDSMEKELQMSMERDIESKRRQMDRSKACQC